LRLLIETNDRLVQFGTAGAEQNLAQRNRGAVASPTNVEYRLSRRSNGEDWALIAYDGTTSLFAIEVDYSASKVYINGIDVTAIIPGGGTNGNFLQKGSPNAWAQVDMGVSTNVKTTGATLSRFAFLRANGTLEGKEVDLTDATHVELPFSDGVVLSALGGVVSFYTLAGLTSNLDNTALQSKINAIFSLETRLAALEAHDHDYQDYSADSPTGTASGHDHSVSNSASTRTTSGPNL
jgi:hypothetical protein